jgi:hypothetical protein
MLQVAFKEWAVICEALGQGKQAIILRKGGIAEDEAEFGALHTRFWLYPTYVRQQDDGVNDETLPLLQTIEARHPPAGKVRLQLWAEVTGIYRIRDELLALMLPHLHCWSEATVRQRFNDRTPGLFLLVTRVHRLPKAHEIDELPAYADSNWLELEKPLSTVGSTPVLSDADYRIVEKQLDRLLSPTAFA